MSIDLCAAQVARADPDRYAAALSAPLPERGALLVLYAFNLEVARAPWVTQEPLIAQMRLQWWHDAVDEIFDGGPVRAHEVTTPLADVVRTHGLDRAALHQVISARMADVDRGPPASLEALWTYFVGTGGGLAELAGQVLGQGAAGLRAPGSAIAAARYIESLPGLEAAGAHPLPEGMPEDGAVRALADSALTRLASAGRTPRALRPALLHGAGVATVLRNAHANPGSLRAGAGAMSEFAKRLARLRFSLSGRL